MTAHGAAPEGGTSGHGRIDRGAESIQHLTGAALRARGIETPLSDYLAGDLTGSRARAAMAPPTWWRARA